MNQTFFLCALFSLLLASHQAYGGGLSSEAKTRRQSCSELVQPINESGSKESSDDGNSVEVTGVSNVTGVTEVTLTPETLEAETSTDSGYNRTLIVYCYEIGKSLTSAQYELWIEWIQEIEITILANSSLTYEQMIVKISYSLQAFLEVNVDIISEILYAKLGSWGSVIDLIYVGYEIQIEITEKIVTLDSEGSCALFEALRNATSEDSEKAAAVEILIEQITKVLLTSSWSYTQQQAEIYLILEAFFEKYSEWSSFFYSIEIEEYGLLQYYYDAIFWYQQATTISTVIGGSSSESVLLVALEEAYKNTNLSITIRNQIKQIYEKLVAKFEQTTDISVLLAYLSSECYEFYFLLDYLSVYVNQIELESWGSIYDLLFVSQICTNYGCDNINNGPGTLEPETSTVAENSTTVSSTTVPSILEADCSTRSSLLKIDGNNKTIFTTVIEEARLTFSSSYRSSFNSYWNNIRNSIFGSYTQELTLQYVVKNCSSFNGNNPAKQEQFFNVYIEEWKGTIGQFVACGSA